MSDTVNSEVVESMNTESAEVQNAGENAERILENDSSETGEQVENEIVNSNNPDTTEVIPDTNKTFESNDSIKEASEATQDQAEEITVVNIEAKGNAVASGTKERIEEQVIPKVGDESNDEVSSNIVEPSVEKSKEDRPTSTVHEVNSTKSVNVVIEEPNTEEVEEVKKTDEAVMTIEESLQTVASTENLESVNISKAEENRKETTQTKPESTEKVEETIKENIEVLQENLVDTETKTDPDIASTEVENILTEENKKEKGVEKPGDSVVTTSTIVEDKPQQSVETNNKKIVIQKETETSKEMENCSEKISNKDSKVIAADKIDNPLEAKEIEENIDYIKTVVAEETTNKDEKEPIKAFDKIDFMETGRNSTTISDDATESQDSEQLVIDENIATIKSVDEISATIEIEDDEENDTEIRSKEPIQGKPQDTPPESSFEVIEIDDDEDEIAAKKTQDTVTEETEEPKKPIVEKSTEPSEEKTFEKEEEESEVGSTTCPKMHTMPILFYNKECINFECTKNQKEFHRAPQFALNYFNVIKKKIKVQYICGDCYDMALGFYQDFGGSLAAKQPILLRDITKKKQEFVEILDSSDEEESASNNDTENKGKDNQFFSKTDLNLIENELENSIRNIFERVEIQSQLTWTKTIYTDRIKRLQNELEYIDSELHEQQKLADRMYSTLYDAGKYNITTQKPLDLDNDSDPIPPIGEVERLPIKVNETYYAAKNKAIGCWLPCKVIEQTENVQVGLQKSTPCYRVKFLNVQYQTFKNLSAKLMAYYDPPSVRLLVGQRVIAYFDGTTLSPRDKDKCVVQSAFYPGIIAEEMKANNYFRYLIFYDDGYTQYVSHKDVRLVCNVARNVWEDVDPTSREFIQKYIMEYRVNRPMVQTHKGQKMATESNGRWVPARVIDIDCSLVRMQFEGPNKNHTEWIYRGSLRLNPVYMEYQKSKNSQANRITVSRLPRRTEPFIRYTEDEESIRGSIGTQPRTTSNRQESTSSTSQAVTKVRHLNATTIYLEDENKARGKVIHYTAKRQFPPKLYSPHTCGPDCLINVPHNLNGYSPLAKPLLSGWERLFAHQKLKKFVFYRSPCGKMFRSMPEVHKYLRVTRNPLNVDNFDFYPETSCLAEFEAENVLLKKRDISNGQEKMPLPLVNYYDDSLPECTYSSRVIPTEGVNINTDPNFLICCDCEDDCVDKSKCACWQLTIDGVRNTNPYAQINDVGYQYKRLYEHLTTGIYECNSRCKCKSYCINRVVQHSLEMKLQVFKTTNRGWGLRCLNDVPRGAFVCIYAGNLLTEAKANEGGLDAGDEYFAELDYIETVEQLKEGYESDAEAPEDDDEDAYVPDDNDDDDFRPSKSFTVRSKHSNRANSGEGERQAINFNPNVTIDEDSKKKRLSVRQLFGRDEAVYVMDAKVTGNLGRYFNHSCSPNLFVQNVFVDTHDVRFPWVAFFALTHIRSGTELTWNYNYEVGVVPGKVLYCQCGAPNCRQRLL